MPQENETTVNMAFTLDQSIASYIKRRAIAEDMNQSQVVRKILREAMAAESKTKLTRAKRKGSK
jgi:hypothetical protein